MARIIRARPRPAGRTRWWSTLIAGAAVGAVAAWLVLRGGEEEPGADGAGPARARRAAKEPDVEGMTARLRELPGAEQLRLRSLGDGILELVGSATADLDVSALLAALAAEPRVSVVVNRVWTPDSGALETDLEAEPEPPPSRAAP